MSRFLEMSVDGTIERVSERAVRAFRRIGKITDQQNLSSYIVGVVKVDGEPADLRVAWRPGREGRVRLEMVANSEDVLNQAADDALYIFAKAYKAVGWPSAERERQERLLQRKQWLLRGIALVGAIALLFAVVKTIAP